MRVVEKEEFEASAELARKIKSGAVFIHPTDTIYGLGCDASNSEAVERIRELKNRPSQPFSVIAPSVDWIRKHCEINSEAESWLKKLPGPYTLILNIKDQNNIAKEVNGGLKTIGIRIPEHWFTGHAQKLDVPIVSTSANKTSDDFMTSLESLNEDIKHSVDFIIYEGEKNGRPSQIVDLTGSEASIKKRDIVN